MYILTNVSYDTDGRLYAGRPTYFDTEEEAVKKAKENLAEDFGLEDQDEFDELADERKGDPYTICIDLDGRLEAYIISELAQPQKLTVKTPAGAIFVEAKGTYDEYPGFYICKDNKDKDEIAMVEFDTERGEIQTVTYMEGKDDPAYLVDYRTGINRV